MAVYSFSSIVISNVSLIMSKALLQFYCIMFPIRRILLFASFISHRNKVILFFVFSRSIHVHGRSGLTSRRAHTTLTHSTSKRHK